MCIDRERRVTSSTHYSKLSVSFKFPWFPTFRLRKLFLELVEFVSISHTCIMLLNIIVERSFSIYILTKFTLFTSLLMPGLENQASFIVMFSSLVHMRHVFMLWCLVPLLFKVIPNLNFWASLPQRTQVHSSCCIVLLPVSSIYWRSGSSNENFAVKWSFLSHTSSSNDFKPLSWQSLFASLVRRFRGPSEGYRSSYSAVNFWAIYAFPFRTCLSSSFCIISALPRLPWPFLLTGCRS